MVSTTFTSDAGGERAATYENAINPWIVNPIFDTLFVFGGLLWILFGLQIYWFHWTSPDPAAPGAAGTAAFFLLLMSTLGGHIFADAHTVSTYVRVYSTKENRERFRLYTYYLPWCSLLLFSLCLLYPQAAGFCVYLHLMWVYQHYVGQSFGISLIYCYKRGYFFKNWERETYRWFMHSISAFVITRILCFREFTPNQFFGVALPFYDLPKPIFYCARTWFLVMTIAFVGIIVRKYILEKKLIPIPTLALIITSMGFGLLSGMASAVVWLYGAPFFHGSQYLAVSLAFYLKEKAPDAAGVKAVSRHLLKGFFSAEGLRYWAIVVSGGMFIYVMIPHVLENYGYTFGMVATTIQACINFHHFVTDGAVWRLRDKATRDILLA